MTRNFLRRFYDDEGGSILAIFGLTILLLIFVLGVAVDYSRSLSVKTSVQSLLDASLLAGVAEARQTGGASSELAKAYFMRNWENKFDHHLKSLNVILVDGSSLNAEVQIGVPTLLLQVVGKSEIGAKLNSAVSQGEGTLELVLALDTTGSMSGTKLDDLKTAAKDLTSELFTIPKASERVRLGVVPFANYVNVGLANRGASWISVEDDSSTTEARCYNKRKVISKTNCRTQTGTGTRDGVPYTYSHEVCDYEYSDPVWTCEDRTTTRTWRGCVGSRDYPLNVQDASYETRVPGIMNVSCGAAITPLTSEETIVTDAIDALVAAGETYIPGGLAWAWRALSASEPYSEGSEYSAKKGGIEVRKVLILMTDGANTKSPTYPNHSGSDGALANTLTSELCTAVTEKDIDIFTVAFEVTDEDTKQMLRECASRSDRFFDATNSEKLRLAFRAIVKEITPLRLTN